MARKYGAVHASEFDSMGFLGCGLMMDVLGFDFLMYFYVLNYVFMFFNFVKINKLIF